MKNSIKIVLVGLAIVMSFAAVQAFGDQEFKKGPGGPNVVLELDIAEGCVISSNDDWIGGITLCNDSEQDCVEAGDDDCNACEPEDKTTILGTGPAFYWSDCVTLETDAEGGPFFVQETKKYVEIQGEGFDIDPPAPCDYVRIGYYPSRDGEYFIALWVVVKTNDGVSAVLLRNQDTLEVLWKAIGKNKKGKKKPNSED